MAPVIPNYDDGMGLVEGDVIQPRLFLGHHCLHAHRVVLVDVEVKDVNPPVHGDCSENCAGVGRPGNVSHLGVQVKHEQWLSGK